MYVYTQYGPYICIGFVFMVLFVLWVAFSGQHFDFIPGDGSMQNTCMNFTRDNNTFLNTGLTGNYEQNSEPSTSYNVTFKNTVGILENGVLENGVLENGVLENGVLENGVLENGVLENGVLENGVLEIDNTPIVSKQFQISDLEVNNEEIPVNPLEIDLGENVPESKSRTAFPIINATSNYISSRKTIYGPALIKGNNLLNTQYSNENTSNSNFTKSLPPSNKFLSRGERLCCQSLERIYGVPFKSVRPSWLKNPETGKNLELDCFNEDLQIAGEYNGIQHYKWPNFTNQTREQFINQVRRDQYKAETCDKNGVYLIIVPYNISHEKIYDFIISHLPETVQKRLQEE